MRPGSKAQSTKAPWDGVVLVCRKCSRKLDGGFGPDGRQKLAKALREALRARGWRRALRIVPVDCLGLCPKRAVTVIGPAAPGHVLTVPQGADVEQLLQVLAPGLA